MALEALLQNFDWVEIGLVVSLLTLFVMLTFFSDRWTWIWVEIIIALSVGVGMLAVPEHVLRLVVSEAPTERTVFLARLFGAIALSNALTWYTTSETRDATVPITLMMSRVCMSSAMLMAQLFSYCFPTKTKSTTESGKPVSSWSEAFLVTCVLPTTLWMLGNLIHLLRSRDFNTYPQHNIRLNNLLRIDAWLMLLSGILMLAFPRQLVNLLFSSSKPPKEVTLFVMRCCGAMGVGEAVVSLQAPGFLHTRDKLAVFTTHIVSKLFELAVLLAGCFLLGLINIDRLYYTAAFILPVLINAIVGRLFDGTTIYSIRTPAKKIDDGRKVTEFGDGAHMNLSTSDKSE